MVGATHNPLAAPVYTSDQQPGLLYGLAAIAFSAQHLLESFQMTADTASIEVASTQQRVNFPDLLSYTSHLTPTRLYLLQVCTHVPQGYLLTLYGILCMPK